MKNSKLFLIGALSILILSACTEKASDKLSFSIEGVVEGLPDGECLQLTDADGQPLDTLVVSNGRFSYQGLADSVGYYSLNVVSDEFNGVSFFTEKGTIHLLLTSEPGHSKVSGTVANDALQQLTEVTAPYYEKIHEIETAIYSDTVLTEDNEWALAERYMQILNEINKKITEAAQNNIDNELGFMLVTRYIDPSEDSATMRELIAKMPATFRSRPAVAAIEKQLQEQQLSEIGMKILDFKMSTPDGALVSLSEKVREHQLTILDFWASWCGPCRNEMPFMRDLYAEFGPKGLGIIGISLDENIEAWKKAIEELKITWPQLSDLQNAVSPIAQYFQVNAIPFIAIVDAEGTIVQKGLRGEALKEYISQQFE